ncbi:MAG: protein kinase [archaeon]|nr:protein kinase [archaeon]
MSTNNPVKISKYTKTEENYFTDCLFDLIDIKANLSKNHLIKKVPNNLFLYRNDLKEKNAHVKEKSTAMKYNSQEHKEETEKQTENHKINFEEFNDNRFGIDFNELRLEYSDNYIVKFTDCYFPIQILGQGAFGLVISCVDLTNSNDLIAVKIIDKRKVSNKDESKLFQEVNILKNLDNPRILKIFEVLNTTDYFFIFMELIKGGTLKDLILKRYKDTSKDYLFTDEECSTIVKGILQATNYLHQNNIVHRDLKPENILLKDENDLNSIILCDFGMACEFSNYELTMQEKCGTLLFMAPEVIEKKAYDQLADSFSTGIILYVLASGGTHPIYKHGMNSDGYQKIILNSKSKQRTINKGYSLRNLDEDEKKKNVGDNVNPFFIPETMPVLARNLFLKLCKFETFNRFEIFRALNHPWITRNPETPIPLTVNEGFERTEKISKFKTFLSTMIFVKIYRDQKLTKKEPPKEEIKDDSPSKKRKIISTEINFKKKFTLQIGSKSPKDTITKIISCKNSPIGFKPSPLKKSPMSFKESPKHLKKEDSYSIHQHYQSGLSPNLLGRINKMEDNLNEDKETKEAMKSKRKLCIDTLNITNTTPNYSKKYSLKNTSLRKSSNALTMIKEMKAYNSIRKSSIISEINVTEYDFPREKKRPEIINEKEMTLKPKSNKNLNYKISYTPTIEKLKINQSKANPLRLKKDPAPVKISGLKFKKSLGNITLPLVGNTPKNSKTIISNRYKASKTEA